VVDESGSPVEGVEVKPVWSGLDGLFAPGVRSNDAGMACFPAPAPQVFAEGLGWDLGAVTPSAPPYPDLRVAPVCRRKVTVDWGASAGVVNATYARVQLRGGFGAAVRLGPGDPEDGEPRALPCAALATYMSEARGWSVEPAVVPAGTEDIHLRIVASPGTPTRQGVDDPGRLDPSAARVVTFRCRGEGAEPTTCPSGMAGVCEGAAGWGSCSSVREGTCACPEGEAQIVAASVASGGGTWRATVGAADVAAVLTPGTGELAVAAAEGSRPGTLWKVDGAEAILVGPPGRREPARAVWSGLAPGAYLVLGYDALGFGPYSLDEGETREVERAPMGVGPPRSFGSEGLGGAPAAVVTCPGRQQFVPFVQPGLSVSLAEECAVTLCGSTAGCAVDADGRCAPDAALACPNGVDVEGHQVGDREPR